MGDLGEERVEARRRALFCSGREDSVRFEFERPPHMPPVVPGFSVFVEIGAGFSSWPLGSGLRVQVDKAGGPPNWDLFCGSPPFPISGEHGAT